MARLDGRGFTRLTKEEQAFEAPFDERFRDLMLHAAEQLLREFSGVYAFAQSDEISLLFPLDCGLFGRNLRKLNSVLAGYASACFPLQLGSHAVFDCRICELPNAALVVDYFRWRNEDAHRNSLNAHCYWLLRKRGKSVNEATRALEGLYVASKNELLFQAGINFNDLPSWQKRGSGLYWQDQAKVGHNPKTGETTQAMRRVVHRELSLPMKDGYSQFVAQFVTFAK